MKRVILYVHGMGGSPQEAEHYGKFCAGFDVVGVEYDCYVPDAAVREIRACYDSMRKDYVHVYLIANSLGAYFSMLALQACEIEKALFVSPVLNMEKLILAMLSAMNLSEEDLRERGRVVAPSGEILSWEYLRFVRANPITWNVPTEILYAERDNITPREVVNEFLGNHDARLTVMKDGEHWFHTEEQIAFLDSWVKNVLPK